MDETMNNEAEAIRDMAVRAANPVVLEEGALPYALIPEGHKVAELENLLPAPRATRRKVALADVASFIRYINLFKTEATQVFADQIRAKLVAVMDFDTRGAPAWAAHEALYLCPVSKEWEAWNSRNQRPAKQAEFLQFIEDNLPDIVQAEVDGRMVGPTAADMLEVARSIQAHKNIEFKSATKLQDGTVQITYNEDINGTARGGQMAIPEEFYIGIPVFHGGDRYLIKARLRYRIESGVLAMWYDLYRHDRAMDDAFQDLAKAIHTGTGIEPLMGFHRQ